jgi:hypothetical protein
MFFDLFHTDAVSVLVHDDMSVDLLYNVSVCDRAV